MRLAYMLGNTLILSSAAGSGPHEPGHADRSSVPAVGPGPPAQVAGDGLELAAAEEDREVRVAEDLEGPVGREAQRLAHRVRGRHPGDVVTLRLAARVLGRCAEAVSVGKPDAALSPDDRRVLRSYLDPAADIERDRRGRRVMAATRQAERVEQAPRVVQRGR